MVRGLILKLIIFLGIWKNERIGERLSYLHIGLSGHVSDLDKSFAKEQKLLPLNNFQLWLFKPHIESEKKRRYEIFRQSMIDVLGEDPDDW